MKLIKTFLLVAIPRVLVIVLLDITFKFFIEYFNLISVAPRLFYSSSNDVLSDYLSSLGMVVVMSGWVYCIYYLIYTLLRPVLAKFQFSLRLGISYLYYLIFMSISEFLFEGYRMDVLLVIMISAVPMSLLTTKLIPSRALKEAT